MVFVVNLIRYDLLLWEYFNLWNIPTFSINSVRMTCTFPFLQVISIVGNSLCNSKVCCFQIHSVTFYRSIQMAAIIIQTIHGFYTKISEKNLHISAKTYEKNIVCSDYCFAHHDNKTCFLPACKYHIIPLGNVEELLKKLDTLCFTYQHVDSWYTLFKYRFTGKVIAKSGQVFDNVQRAVDFNHRNKEVDRMPSIAKKRLLRKKFKKHFFSSFQKKKTTQTSGLVFAERIEKLKRINLNWTNKNFTLFSL